MFPFDDDECQQQADQDSLGFDELVDVDDFIVRAGLDSPQSKAFALVTKLVKIRALFAQRKAQ